MRPLIALPLSRLVKVLSRATRCGGQEPSPATIIAFLCEPKGGSMKRTKLSRRRFIAGSAAAVGAVSGPFVRRANAAGKLTIGLWDHWVPGANDAQSALIKEWADKENVEVNVDYITSQGNKLLLTLAAESQAKAGHDIMEFTNWESAQFNQA